MRNSTVPFWSGIGVNVSFPLRDKVSHTNIAHWCIRADDGLLHLRTLVFGDNGRCNMQPAIHVGLWQLEGEALRVVIDQFRLLEHQRDETLVTAGEGRLRLSDHRIALRAVQDGLPIHWAGIFPPQIDVCAGDNTECDAGVEETEATLLLLLGRGLGRIATDML